MFCQFCGYWQTARKWFGPPQFRQTWPFAGHSRPPSHFLPHLPHCWGGCCERSADRERSLDCERERGRGVDRPDLPCLLVSSNCTDFGGLSASCVMAATMASTETCCCWPSELNEDCAAGHFSSSLIVVGADCCRNDLMSELAPSMAIWTSFCSAISRPLAWS